MPSPPKPVLSAKARELGFDALGVASATASWPAGARLAEFLALGRHGDMGWMAQYGPPAPTPASAAQAGEGAGGPGNKRAHPQALWPEAKSAILVGSELRARR